STSERRALAPMAFAGIICAAACALKATGAVLIVPFAALLFARNSRGLPLLPGFFLLFTPMTLLLLATIGYNEATFGDPLRNGYHFWVAVPYDIPRLTFSLRYVPENLRTAAIDSGLALLALLCALWPGAKRWARGRGAELLCEP